MARSHGHGEDALTALHDRRSSARDLRSKGKGVPEAAEGQSWPLAQRPTRGAQGDEVLPRSLDEETADRKAISVLDVALDEQFEQFSGRSAAAAAAAGDDASDSPPRHESKQQAPQAAPLRTDWLERVLNIVLLRPGFRERVEAQARKGRASATASKGKLTKAVLSSFSQAVPGAEFLPPALAFLAQHPGSFHCAQGVLRDCARVSRRVGDMLRRGDCFESLHPHTRQAMVSILLAEDDPSLGTEPGAEQPQGALLLVQLLGYLQVPVLAAFMSRDLTCICGLSMFPGRRRSSPHLPA